MINTIKTMFSFNKVQHLLLFPVTLEMVHLYCGSQFSAIIALNYGFLFAIMSKMLKNDI
jgi:hypothetical protein